MADPAIGATPTPETAPVTPEVQPETTETEESTLLGEAGEETKADDGQKKEDATEKETPKEEKAADKVVPEKYEIKVPEGMTLDAQTLEMFSPIFKELGITNEGAQKLVNAYVPLLQSSVDKMRQESLKEYQGIVEGWKSETMKELGADAQKKIALCGKALNKFGTKELREALDETGLGNHKELVRFMAKIGETISEDTFVDTESKPLPGASGINLKKMYPTMAQ